MGWGGLKYPVLFSPSVYSETKFAVFPGGSARNPTKPAEAAHDSSRPQHMQEAVAAPASHVAFLCTC